MSGLTMENTHRYFYATSILSEGLVGKSFDSRKSYFYATSILSEGLVGESFDSRKSSTRILMIKNTTISKSLNLCHSPLDNGFKAFRGVVAK